MEHPYMIVAFLNEQKVSEIIEPPQNPHVTIKKKFKLKNLSESALTNFLKELINTEEPLSLELGGIAAYGSEETKYVVVKNKNSWCGLHQRLTSGLNAHIETRDLHFEGDNYLPHVTWKLKGREYFDPVLLCDTTLTINKLYLIKRLQPAIMKVKVLSVLDLSSQPSV